MDDPFERREDVHTQYEDDESRYKIGFKNNKYTDLENEENIEVIELR
ncbi:hypothetical protein [Salibacterium salarium]|nr:hypothetical protein [Salibacterium salarium]